MFNYPKIYGKKEEEFSYVWYKFNARRVHSIYTSIFDFFFFLAEWKMTWKVQIQSNYTSEDSSWESRSDRWTCYCPKRGHIIILFILHFHNQRNLLNNLLFRQEKTYFSSTNTGFFSAIFWYRSPWRRPFFWSFSNRGRGSWWRDIDDSQFALLNRISSLLVELYRPHLTSYFKDMISNSENSRITTIFW